MEIGSVMIAGQVEWGSDLVKQTYANSILTQGDPLAFWSFEQAWPVKWSVSDFNAQDSTIAIETLELTYTRFQQQRVPK